MTVTGIRKISNSTNSDVVAVRGDVPRFGGADHLVVRAHTSVPCDWNVPWSDEHLARMMAGDPSSNDGRGIKFITGPHIWVIWQEVRGSVDGFWIIEGGAGTVSQTTPRNAVGGNVALEVDAAGPPRVIDY